MCNECGCNNKRLQASVSQLVEDAGSNPVECEFESHQMHQIYYCLSCGNQQSLPDPCQVCGVYAVGPVSDK